MDRDEFRDSIKSSGNYANWKEKGKFTFFVHPGGNIGKRTLVRLRRVVVSEKTGQEEIWSVARHFEGKKGDMQDITECVLKFIKDCSDIDADDVVLSISCGKGKSRKKEEYTKGDLLGLDGYNWKKSLLRPRTEYVFCVVPADVKIKTAGVQLLPLPYTAGKKLNKVWDRQEEKLGEEEGNPFKTPYATTVYFDETERASDMYDVEPESDVKLTKGVKKSFKMEPNDCKALCDPDNEDTSDGTKLQLLKAMWVHDIPCPALEGDEEEVDEEASSKKKKKAKGKKKASPKKKAKKKASPKKKAAPAPEPEEDDDDDDDEGDTIAAKDCEVDEEYVVDGKTATFKKNLPKSKRSMFVTEDGEKLKVKFTTQVSPVGEDDSDDDDDDDEEGEEDDNAKVTVTDCVKGSWYYDDGDKLKFVKYNHAKEKGVFRDEDGDKQYLDGDDTVTTDPPDDDDALEPRTSGKKKTSKSKPEPEEDEGEMEECPYCDKDVPADATKCPHCKGDFADDDEDGDAPFDDDDDEDE